VTRRITRLAQDQSVDPLDVVKILMAALSPEEQQAFKSGLAEMLGSEPASEPEPAADEPAGPEANGLLASMMKGGGTGGPARNYAFGGGQDRAMSRSFQTRFPNASRVQGSASAKTTRW
jgi:hypothetical protein